MEIFNVLQATMPNAIIGFTGQYRWLSMESPVEVEYDGKTYPSVLHALAAAATTSKEVRERIKGLRNTASVRDLLKNPPHPEPRFHADKAEVLAVLLLQKFGKQNEALRARLKAIPKNTLLVHENQNGDTFWGVVGKRGFNVLGHVLMNVRDEVVKQDSMVFSGPEKN